MNELRSKESAKRADAAKARMSASSTSSASTAKSRLREAERREQEAIQAGKDAASWQKRVTTYGKDEQRLLEKLGREEASEAKKADEQVKRDQRNRDAERAMFERRIADAEAAAAKAHVATHHISRQEIPEPKPEKLRILMLGADSDGADEGRPGLRIGREQQRIRRAVQAATHRDLIEFDMRPAATPDDLLDGISRFRPHVVHFSGHSNEAVLAMEDDLDQPHAGLSISTDVFARTLAAADNRPLLVLLNSCNSAAQIDQLVARCAPFAIGMSESIADTDAIVYAAQFYASIANGQSVLASHELGRSALALAGLDGVDLPILECAPNIDPRQAILVFMPAA